MNTRFRTAVSSPADLVDSMDTRDLTSSCTRRLSHGWFEFVKAVILCGLGEVCSICSARGLNIAFAVRDRPVASSSTVAIQECDAHLACFSRTISLTSRNQLQR